MPCHTSPPQVVIDHELVVIDPITNLNVVDDIIDTIVESALRNGVSSHLLPQKGFQRPAIGSQSKARAKKKIHPNRGRMRNRPCIFFTSEVEAMVTQEFALPNYPSSVLVAGFVGLLHFMFPCYNWEYDNLVGFNGVLVKYRDLSSFKGNFRMWFDAKFCTVYGAWTSYNKVTISCHVLHFRKRTHCVLNTTPPA